MLTTQVKEIISSKDVPNNVYLTSDLMHEKTISFYFDALDKRD